MIWLAGLFWFASQIPPAEKWAEHADAIVILTGGKGRLEYGLKLFVQGKADKLFISGVGEKTSLEALLHNVPEGLRNEVLARPAESIQLGHAAENTIGNAEETAAWVNGHSVHSLILVTANYHMLRSVSEFEEKLPNIAILPAPVLPEDFQIHFWWLRGYERDMVLSEYHKYVAAKLRHWYLALV